MVRIGADPERLRSVAARMAQTADQLELMARRGTARTLGSGWTGPDAEWFARRWRAHHAPALRRTSALLRNGAAVLRANAVGQESASATGPTGRSPAATAGPVTTRAAPLRHEAAPVTIRSERLDLEAGGSLALLGGTGGRSISIEHRSDGTIVVSTSDALGAGLIGRAPTPVSGTHVQATAGGTVERSWSTTTGELPVLLAALLTESSPLGTPARAVDGAAGVLDSVLGRAGLPTGFRRWTEPMVVPPADEVERLVAAGTAGAATLGPLRGAGEGHVAVGRRQGAGGSATVLEWSQTSSHRLRADWTRSLGRSLGVEWNPSVDARIDGRIEVADGGAGGRSGRTLIVRLESTEGVDRTVLEASVDLDRTGATATLVGPAVAALGSGNPVPVGELLGAVAADGGADWRIDHYRVERTGVTVPVSNGIAGASLAGTREVAVRR